MNVQNLISEIEKVDPEVYDRLDTRRNAMRRFSFIGKTLAMAAVPSALGAMFKKAYGQTANTQAIRDTLNFALTLEYLEAEFYKKVVSSFTAIGVPAGPAQAALTTIRDHEVAHVAFLRQTITALGATPVSFTFSNFDYTAGNGSMNGPFASVFTNYAVMLAVSQTFEDTGVRAYKGQAGNLIDNNAVLTAALQIHSVEARHASHIRQMRRNLNQAIPSGQTVQPWITLNQSGIASGSAGGDAAIQMSYNGEEVTNQASVNITGTFGGITIGANEASEAFDEPLTTQQVLAIVDPFII